MNWYLENGKESDVVNYSQVELKRNVENYPFSHKMTSEQRKKLLETVKYITPSLGYHLQYFAMKDMDEITIRALAEKKLIPYGFGKNEDTAILMNDEENICILIGGEEHIIIQVFVPGLDLQNAMYLATEIDEKMQQQLKFSYNEKYGYLTANPMSCGTGVKAYTIVHLPALTISHNLSKMIAMIQNLGMIVTNEYGEDIQENTAVYKITNHQTIGLTEEAIIKNIENITKRVIEQERVARKYLGKHAIELADKVYRSYGILVNAKKLTYKETEQLLSDVKLGTDLGIIVELNDAKVKKMLFYAKEANLLKREGKVYNAEEIEIKRAEVMKQIARRKLKMKGVNEYGI